MILYDIGNNLEKLFMPDTVEDDIDFDVTNVSFSSFVVPGNKLCDSESFGNISDVILMDGIETLWFHSNTATTLEIPASVTSICLADNIPLKEIIVRGKTSLDEFENQEFQSCEIPDDINVIFRP